MGRKNYVGLFLTVLFIFTFFHVTSDNRSAHAANRYIAQKYSFDATGALLTPLTADFGSVKKTAYVERKELSPDKRLLLVAYATGSDSVFAVQMFDSYNYSIYKVRLRDDKREEIVILGLGKPGEKRVPLQEIRIIGENTAGELVSFPVQGFQPAAVLNSPLQLDGDRVMRLSLGVNGKDIKIYWDAAAEAFVCANSAAPTQAPAAATADKGEDI